MLLKKTGNLGYIMDDNNHKQKLHINTNNINPNNLSKDLYAIVLLNIDLFINSNINECMERSIPHAKKDFRTTF